MKIILAGALALMAVGAHVQPTHAAEPIVGTWKLEDGRTIRFSGRGSRYCGTVVGGKFGGKSIGCLSGKGQNYRGKITDLSAGKTYTGKARVRGSSMRLSGCVLGGLICRNVNASRR